MPKWSSKNAIGQALRKEILQNDYIGRGVSAADVWKSNPIYKQFKLDNFRTNYNNMKKAIKDEKNEGADAKAKDAMKLLSDNFDCKYNLLFSILNKILL